MKIMRGAGATHSFTIGISLFPLELRGGGMRQYVLQMVPELIRNSQHQYLLFYRLAGLPTVAAMLRQLPVEDLRRVETVEIENDQQIAAYSDRFDVYFCPLNGFSPPLLDRPTLATLADIQERFFPEYFTPGQVEARGIVYPQMARSVTTLVTISEFSKQTICDEFQVARDKVVVTHLAPNAELFEKPAHWPESFPKLPAKYILYPANLYPHKNHDLLLRSLRRVLDVHGVDCRCVLTGHVPDPHVDLEGLIRKYKLEECVQWLGHVPGPALRHLYESAHMMAFPSQFEGFGMPIVEAMTLRCPVVAAFAASIPEICGEGAILVGSPTAVAEEIEFADALAKVWTDDALRQRLIDAGCEQAKKFNVPALVQSTLTAIEQTHAKFWNLESETRLPVTLVLRCGGGEELVAAVTRLLPELQPSDQVIVAHSTPLSERSVALCRNQENLETVPADSRSSWLDLVQHDAVCILTADVTLCAGAINCGLAGLQRRVRAVAGETLILTSSGASLEPGYAGDPQAPIQRPANVRMESVFWRNDFLKTQQKVLAGAQSASVLLSELPANGISYVPRAFVRWSPEPIAPPPQTNSPFPASNTVPAAASSQSWTTRQLGRSRRLAGRVVRGAKSLLKRPSPMPTPTTRSVLPSSTSATGEPSVAVVIPVFNKLKLTLRFLESFKSVEYKNYKLIIADDASTDGSAAAIRQQYPEVVVLDGSGDLWWAGGTNLGVEYALKQNFDYILTINNDTRVAPDFLTRLVETAQQRPRCIVGCLIKHLEEPDRVWAAGGYVDWANNLLFQLWHQDADSHELVAKVANPFPVDILTGCGTLIPAACFREIGLYDAVWCPQYHADSEIVLRARAAGYEAVVDLRAVVWNDVENTSRVDNIYSRRSPLFWRPFYRVHSRYSPRKLPGLRYILTTLNQRHISPMVKKILRPFWRATSFLRTPVLNRIDRHIGKVLSEHLFAHSEREKAIADTSAERILAEIRELRQTLQTLRSENGVESDAMMRGKLRFIDQAEAFVHPFRKTAETISNEDQVAKSVG